MAWSPLRSGKVQHEAYCGDEDHDEYGVSRHLLPNVKDEPRRELARSVRQHDP
jgi:hypothetical protein